MSYDNNRNPIEKASGRGYDGPELTDAAGPGVAFLPVAIREARGYEDGRAAPGNIGR